MEHTAIFEEQVAVTPKDMRPQKGVDTPIESFDKLILEKIQTRLEGRCSRHGYVKGESIKVLSRSMGGLEKGRFTGSILYHIQAEGTVINPPAGVLVDGKVIRKNKMGLYVSYEDAIRVIVPRDLHIGDEEFDAVEIGDTVQVEIQKSRFQVNDPFILSVGLYRKTVTKGMGEAEAAAAVAVTPLEVPAEEEGGEGGEEVARDEDVAEDVTEEVEDVAEEDDGPPPLEEFASEDEEMGVE